MGLSEMIVSIRSSSHIHPYAIVSPIVSKPQLRFLNVSGCCAALTCLSCRGCHYHGCRKISVKWKKWMWLGDDPTDKSNQGTYWIIGNIGIEVRIEWDLTLSMLLHQQFMDDPSSSPRTYLSWCTVGTSPTLNFCPFANCEHPLHGLAPWSLPLFFTFFLSSM